MDERAGGGRGGARGLALLAIAVLTAACGDAATAPETYAVTVVSGGDQRGLEGRRLPEPIHVEVLDEDGVPVALEPVTVTVRAGAGSAVAPARTDVQGRLEIVWRLGPAEVPEQALSVRVGEAERAVAARSLPEEAGDLLVVRNAAGPLKGVVALRTGSPTGFGVIVDEVVTPDTLVRLQPGARRDEVIVFPWDNPPERAFLDWTERLDTGVVVLRDPVAIDFRVYVSVPVAFDEKAAEVEADLDALRFVNVEEGWGLAIGDVEVVDLTAGADTTGAVSGPDACRSPAPVQAVNVHYVWRIVQYWGYACPPGLVYMSHQRGLTAPYLFPHEMGHVLGLNHTEGLMDPSATTFGLTEGQILRSHYQPWSSLNLTFRALPPEAQGNCGLGRCVPESYTLPGVRPR